MAPIASFFSDVSFSQRAADSISKNRRQLDGVLFFDRLLQILGIHQASTVYPPRSQADLKTLVGKVQESSSPDQNKYSVLYYLLKDSRSERRQEGAFAESVQLPERYITFVNGIWHLDQLEFQTAIDYLTEPSLLPTFPEEVLFALCKHCKDNPSLILSYYDSLSSKQLSSPKALDALLGALCQGSLTETYFALRGHGAIERRHLLEFIISFAHGSSGGEVRAQRALELIALPLEEDEERWMKIYLTKGKGKDLFGAKDTLIMRQIAKGNGAEAIELSKGSKDRKIDGLNWSRLTQNLQP